MVIARKVIVKHKHTFNSKYNFIIVAAAASKPRQFIFLYQTQQLLQYCQVPRPTNILIYGPKKISDLTETLQ